MAPPFRIGTRQGSTFWLNTEPCGLICGCMTWLLLFYGMYATTAAVIVPWLGFSLYGIVNLIFFNSLSLTAMYSHIKVMCTDPGAVPGKALPLLDDQQEVEYAAQDACIDNALPYKKYCRRCKGFKPPRAHHCSICGRCIVKMDHHCPWVNNCVGVGNHKLFLLFVFWVFVTCMYSMVLVLCKYINCIGKGHKCHSGPENHLLVIFLVVESILFGLFTLCMLGDQLSAIQSNQTQIDRLKNTKATTYQTEVNEVCGTSRNVSFRLSWLIPSKVVFEPASIRDRVLGYRLHSSNSPNGSDHGENEEFSPLMDGSAHPLVHNNNTPEGDIELGSVGGAPPHHGGSGGGGGGMGVSSPNGGMALRKKMPHRHHQSGQDSDSQDTASTDSFDNDDPIQEWLTDHHSSASNNSIPTNHASHPSHAGATHPTTNPIHTTSAHTTHNTTSTTTDTYNSPRVDTESSVHVIASTSTSPSYNANSNTNVRKRTTIV